MTSTPYLYPQISMGQNQDKLEGEEQALCEGLEETRLYPDLGGAGSLTGDVIEGGSSCEEEAGITRKNSGEPDTEDLDGSPCQEATTPSNEKRINLCTSSSFVAKEVRQGGAAGKEGGVGGRTAPVVLQETYTNQRSSAKTEERTRAYKLFNQIKGEERLAEEVLQTSSKIKMEYQDDGTVPHEEIQEEISHEKPGLGTSEDVNTLDNSGEGSVRTSQRGAHPGGSELLSVQIQTIIAEVENEDTELTAGTVWSLRERKEPPPAQPLHPLKNSQQKESLLDMSDAIHYRKENNNNEVRPVLSEYSLAKAKVTDADIQKESVRPYLQTYGAEAATHREMDSDSASNPALSIEPSSILEKLLKRNKKEANPDISKIKEVNIDSKESRDVLVELNANSVSAATELSGDGLDHSGCDTKGILPSFADSKANLITKDDHIKGMHMKQTHVTSDGLCFQPGNNICENPLTKPHNSRAGCQSSGMNIHTVSSLNSKMEVKPDECPSKTLFSDNLQLTSADSSERASCEVSGVITEGSAPTSVSDTKTPPTQSDGGIAYSSQSVIAEETNTSTMRSPPQIQSDSDCRPDPELSGSERAESHSVSIKKVEDSTEDTDAVVVDDGSALVAGRTVMPEESRQVTTSMKKDPQIRLNTETQPDPDQLDKNPGKEKDDNVSRRDKSQTAPKSRPVSDLIKETIQLHEKLQHQERPKPAEVKTEEQCQSVKVAQMKAAFDSAQKSPDKAIERKPSVRKGKDIQIFFQSIMHHQISRNCSSAVHTVGNNIAGK